MSGKGTRRPYQPPAPPAPAVADIGSVARGGMVHRTYGAATPEERRDVLEAIGLKWWQRLGHRHKVRELRDLRGDDAGWAVVDAWVAADDEQAGGRRAFAEAFDPLVRALIERARELLGDHADEPTTEQLAAMCAALADERSAVQARVLLAAVVELEFTAAPEAQAVAAGEARFGLPQASTPS